MHLTSATITDDQIRDLYSDGHINVNLKDLAMFGGHAERTLARGICALVLNSNLQGRSKDLAMFDATFLLSEHDRESGGEGDEPTKVEGIFRTNDCGGGSLQGYVTTSYARLVELFGPPNSESDGYKVSTEWALKVNGVEVRLYDYKETDLYDEGNPTVEEFRALPEYEWHIGGEKSPEFDAAVAFLRGALTASAPCSQ